MLFCFLFCFPPFSPKDADTTRTTAARKLSYDGPLLQASVRRLAIVINGNHYKSRAKSDTSYLSTVLV